MKKILVVGIGAIGGYIGGLLAKRYEDDNSVEVNFLVRGKNLEEINENGLTVVNKEVSFTSKPQKASENPKDFEVMDYIIVCTKSYDLEETIKSLKPCVGAQTVFLPLLNGVDSRDVIEKYYPEKLILDGCIYIISRLTKPGQVENLGNIETLYFGLENSTDERLKTLESVLKNANVQATYAKDISKVIWEKFIFISALATATSALDKKVGEITGDTESYDMMKALLNEVASVARAKNINVDENIVKKQLDLLQSMPAAATSSMHSDYQNNKPSEVKSLTEYVIQEADVLNVSVPTYHRLLKTLATR